MRIAKEGYPFILTALTLTVVAFAVGWKIVAAVLALLTLAVAGFFRDPERQIPTGEDLVVAPADGRVVSIAEVTHDAAFSGTATRLSIFLSPLDVHINRAPVAGKIEAVNYHPGRFLAAYKEEASRCNEQNMLKIIDPRGRPFRVVQIAGFLARRIVCRVKIGATLARGERFGLIMFGSRTDLFLPSSCRLEVTEGQRVKGGATILGRFV